MPHTQGAAGHIKNKLLCLTTKEGGALVAGQFAVVEKTSTVDEEMLLLHGVHRLIRLKDRFLLCAGQVEGVLRLGGNIFVFREPKLYPCPDIDARRPHVARVFARRWRPPVGLAVMLLPPSPGFGGAGPVKIEGHQDQPALVQQVRHPLIYAALSTSQSHHIHQVTRFLMQEQGIELRFHYDRHGFLGAQDHRPGITAAL